AFTEEGAASAPAPGGPVQFRHQAFDVTPAIGAAVAAQAALAPRPGMGDFLAQHAGRRETTWDGRGNRPNLMMGSGIPLVPGRGNALRSTDVGLAAAQSPTHSFVEALLRRFVAAHANLFRVALQDLRLHPDSGPVGPNGRLWLAEFEVLHGGVPIR